MCFFKFLNYRKYDIFVNCLKSKKYDICVECFYENVVFHAVLQFNVYQNVLLYQAIFLSSSSKLF